MPRNDQYTLFKYEKLGEGKTSVVYQLDNQSCIKVLKDRMYLDALKEEYQSWLANADEKQRPLIKLDLEAGSLTLPLFLYQGKNKPYSLGQFMVDLHQDDTIGSDEKRIRMMSILLKTLSAISRLHQNNSIHGDLADNVSDEPKEPQAKNILVYSDNFHKTTNIALVDRGRSACFSKPKLRDEKLAGQFEALKAGDVFTFAETLNWIVSGRMLGMRDMSADYDTYENVLGYTLAAFVYTSRDELSKEFLTKYYPNYMSEKTESLSLIDKYLNCVIQSIEGELKELDLSIALDDDELNISDDEFLPANH